MAPAGITSWRLVQAGIGIGKGRKKHCDELEG